MGLLRARIPVVLFGADGEITNSNVHWGGLQAGLGASNFELRALLIALFSEKVGELEEAEDASSHEVPMHIQDIMIPRYNTILVARMDEPEGQPADGFAVALMNTHTNTHDEQFNRAWEAMRFLSRQDQMFTVYHWKIYEEDGVRKFFATENFVNEKRVRKAHSVVTDLETIGDQITIYNHDEFQKYMADLAGTRKKDSMIVHLHSVKGYDKYYNITGQGVATPGRNDLCEGLAVDITDRVLAKEAQESRARMTLSQFTMLGLSLEFSNMVTTMEGTMAMLEPEDIKEMSREELLTEVEDLKNQVQRGRAISKALLKLTKNNVETEMSRVLVQDDISGVRLTDSCCARIAGTLDSISPGYEVEFTKLVDERTVLPMTEVQFNGAALSMVSNSFRAMKDRREQEGDDYIPLLKVKAEVLDRNPFIEGGDRKKLGDGEGIFTFTVEDNGVGMSSDVVRSATHPYFTTSPETNMGMGLTTLQQLASSYLGNISIKSRPGKGTKVTFWLPIRTDL